MKILAPFFCMVLVASSATAQGVYNMATQRAKNASAQEAQHQQAISQQTAPPPPATPSPGNAQPNSALEATFQNIANLRADFEKFDSNPTNQQPLVQDLTAAPQGTKATPATVASLAANLTTAVAGNKKLQPHYQKLAQSIHALFNSSHLSEAQQSQVLEGVQKILLDSGVSAEATAKVIGNLKTIATETK